MTHSPVFWRQLPVPVSGSRNYRQSSGTRNYGTHRRRMIAAKTKQTYTDSDFEEDDVVVAVIALRLLKTIHKKKQRKRRPRWHGIEHAMFYSVPATGASKNLMPEKYDTLDSFWRQPTGTGNWRQKTCECVVTLSAGLEPVFSQSCAGSWRCLFCWYNTHI